MNIHLYISHPHWSAHCVGVGANCRADVAGHRATSAGVVRCRAQCERRLGLLCRYTMSDKSRLLAAVR